MTRAIQKAPGERLCAEAKPGGRGKAFPAEGTPGKPREGKGLHGSLRPGRSQMKPDWGSPGRRPRFLCAILHLSWITVPYTRWQ